MRMSRRMGIAGIDELLRDGWAFMAYSGRSALYICRRKEGMIKYISSLDIEPSSGAVEGRIALSHGGTYLGMVSGQFFSPAPLYIKLYEWAQGAYNEVPVEEMLFDRLNPLDCAITPDGDLFIATCIDWAGPSSVHHIRAFRRNDGVYREVTPSFYPENSVIRNADGCAFSPDGTLLAVTAVGSPGVTVYRRAGPSLFDQIDMTGLPNYSGARGCAFSADGGYFICWTNAYNGSIYVFTVDGERFTLLTSVAMESNAMTSEKWRCAISPGGEYIAVCVGIIRLRVYKRNGSTYSQLVELDATIVNDPASGFYARSCSFSSDGKYLATSVTAGDEVVGKSPRVSVYARSGDEFTKTKYPIDAPNLDRATGCTFG